MTSKESLHPPLDLVLPVNVVVGDEEKPVHPTEVIPVRVEDASTQVGTTLILSPLQNFLQNFEEKISKGKTSDSPYLAAATNLGLQITRYALHLLPLEFGGTGGVPKKKFPWSFFLIICLPTIMAVLFYGFIASDQYESTADYIITSQEQVTSKQIDPLSMLGLKSGGSSVDKVIAMLDNYLYSPQLLRDLEGKIDLRKIYSSHEIDWFSRLKSPPDFIRFFTRKKHRTTNRQIPDEDLIAYWKGMAKIVPGKADGIETLQIRAFTPQEAKAIADQVLQLGEKLVNGVSERAVNDAVNFARKQVEEARSNAFKISEEVKATQLQSQRVDPLASAKSDFAARDYQDALAGLETARINATRQNLYLETYDEPNLPDTPSYPRRWYSIISVLALSCLLYGVWSLFIAGVKEHQH